eukprot:9114736-Pyramimonas_sp.AAC.1
MWLSLQRRAHSFAKFARVSRIEGWWFSEGGSRLNAGRSRFQTLQEFRGLRAGVFQNVALALAPRVFVFKHYKSFT